jgi:hypothetical protein
MKPLVEIRSTGANAYTYRISAFVADAQEAGDSGTFESLEHCLFDAGRALGEYFANVELNLDGLFMGNCATDALRREPQAVALRIRQYLLPA